MGETHQSKIKKVIKIIREKKSKYLFVSAPENVAWLLNIRGMTILIAQYLIVVY